ncbi:MAG: hypothetical protein H6710_19120 [Myxococcales bacterium]|nr:hypothetical protein [Myxococcales bacterium]
MTVAAPTLAAIALLLAPPPPPPPASAPSEPEASPDAGPDEASGVSTPSASDDAAARSADTSDDASERPGAPPTEASAPAERSDDAAEARPRASAATPTAYEMPSSAGYSREIWAKERHTFNFKRDLFLRNTWPVAPICNMGRPQDLCVTLDAELFAGYRLRSIAGQRFGEFALDRSELGTNLWYRPSKWLDAGATLRIEAIRSAGPQSLIGIDGDSLVIRLAQAYGHVATHLGPVSIGVRGGLIPERWIEQLEKGYDTRGIDLLPSDRNLLFERADLGASITASVLEGLVDLDLQLTNGEGRAQEELNRGKNTTAILTVRPLRRRHAKGPITLALHGAYRDGSWGVGAARAHRAAGALTFASPWAFAGAELVQAFGVREQGDRVSRSIGGWVSAYAWQPYIGLLAKYDHVRQDLRVADSSVDIVTAGAFTDVFGYAWRRRRRVRLYATYQHEGFGASAGPIPGAPQAADAHRFLLQLEAQGLFRAI